MNKTGQNIQYQRETKSKRLTNHRMSMLYEMKEVIKNISGNKTKTEYKKKELYTF
jgi:hypothetical protein